MMVSVLGAGVWGHGLAGWPELEAALAGNAPADTPYATPKPEAVPARERRRAGGMISLAVQVAHEACARAQVPVDGVPSVFVSAMSDTDITDYMCRKLATQEKMLSPTKFHNSVHNAASGYWTISAANRTPSTFVGGFLHSAGSGMLEAASQAVAADAPVLLVAYDLATQPPFDDLVRIEETLGVGLVIAPGAHPGKPAWKLRLEDGTDDACVPTNPYLAQRAERNPIGGLLRLVECSARGEAQPCALAVSAAMKIDMEAA